MYNEYQTMNYMVKKQGSTVKKEKEGGWSLYYNGKLVYGAVAHYAWCVNKRKELSQYPDYRKKELFKIK